MFLLCVLLLTLVALLDVITGPEISSAIFYALPVSLAAWYVNRGFGLAMALAGALAWYLADQSARLASTHPAVPVWNAGTRLAFFMLLVYLLSAFRLRLQDEQRHATTDPLTGLLNHRAFYQIAETELARSRRYKHPFSVAYVDVDNFKQVNDSSGHAAGDLLLRQVAEIMRGYSRTTDVVARLGGDEFAILLVETASEAAQQAVEALRRELLDAMVEAGWPVTFSIGVVSYGTPPPTVSDMVRTADELMYEVKRSGKNALSHAVYAHG